MSRYFTLPAIVALACALAACGFQAPLPKRTPPLPAPEPPRSTLAVSLSIPADQIGRLLDQKTQSHLADVQNRPVKCAIGRCRLTLLATREGPIETHIEDGRLSLDVPFGIDVDLELPGFLSMLRARESAEGTVWTDTQASVTRDWQLRTDTVAHIQLSRSQLHLGPVSADLTDILNSNEEVLSRPVSKAIDHEVDRGVHLRDTIEKAWRRAFMPIKIGKKPPTWLVLAPERFRLAGPAASDGALKLSLGLDVRARVVAGMVPPVASPAPLPPPAPFTGLSDRFSFVVPATLSYKQAANLALASLRQKPPRVAGMTLRFGALEFLPSRNDIVVATTFCVEQSWDPTGLFSSCGSGYLRGSPVFDAATEMIRVTNLHYDVQTEGVLLGAMRALAGPEVGRALESHLKFAVSRDLAKLRDQVSSALAKPEGRDVIISGRMESFGQPQLTWTADGFVALFSATGTVHAALRAL